MPHTCRRLVSACRSSSSPSPPPCGRWHTPPGPHRRRPCRQSLSPSSSRAVACRRCSYWRICRRSAPSLPTRRRWFPLLCLRPSLPVPRWSSLAMCRPRCRRPSPVSANGDRCGRSVPNSCTYPPYRCTCRIAPWPGRRRLRLSGSASPVASAATLAPWFRLARLCGWVGPRRARSPAQPSADRQSSSAPSAPCSRIAPAWRSVRTARAGRAPVGHCIAAR